MTIRYDRIKKYILPFLIISILTSLTAFHVKGQVLIGPVIGGQSNWMVYDSKELKDRFKVSPQLNFHAGISVSFRARKRFYLNTSLLYSLKGKHITGRDSEDLKNVSRYKFIEVPILYTAEFQTKIANDKVFKWYFGAGPTIGYWLGGKGVLQNIDLNENNINPPDYKLRYKIVFNKNPATIAENEMNIVDPNRIQLGLTASAGLIFEPYGQNRIMVNWRYSIGQSFLSRESKGQFAFPEILFYADELKVRNRELVVSLHYFIDLKTSQRKKGKSTSPVKSSKKK
jgi:hypothetical protein